MVRLHSGMVFIGFALGDADESNPWRTNRCHYIISCRLFCRGGIQCRRTDDRLFLAQRFAEAWVAFLSESRVLRPACQNRRDARPPRVRPREHTLVCDQVRTWRQRRRLPVDRLAKVGKKKQKILHLHPCSGGAVRNLSIDAGREGTSASFWISWRV